MTAHMHEAIAVGHTRNLQGIVKFFCLKMRQILKTLSFMLMPIPNRVIHHVNAIGAREKQGHNFHFLNRLPKLYE
jgi:hypothetical protein